MPKINRAIISGGGTGGHIFPAIAIANEIKARNKDAEILFVGASDRMEMEKVPQAGYEIIGLWIAGLQRKLTIDNLLFPVKLISSLMKAKRIVKKFKPDVVVGVGGYASGPTLYAGAKLGVPTLVQEQNSYAGITNKLLAKQVRRLCVAYDGMEKYFPKENIVVTGNPVRKDIAHNTVSRESAAAYFDIDPNKKVLLVIGGSLGAMSINRGMEACIDKVLDSGVQVIWQTGKNFAKEGEELGQRLKDKGLSVHTFIKEMQYAYAACDFVVSRAGALSISELCIVGKPTIFVPYPYAAEDHQTKNAMSLVDKGAAKMIPDHQVKEKLESELMSMIGDEKLQEEMVGNIVQLGIADADVRIVNELERLV